MRPFVKQDSIFQRQRIVIFAPGKVYIPGKELYMTGVSLFMSIPSPDESILKTCLANMEKLIRFIVMSQLHEVNTATGGIF
jgi:hypothetical protein